MDGDSDNDDPQRFALASERAREREVYRHLQPWIDTYRDVELTRPSAFPTEPQAALPKPKPCKDTSLAAFAQLCALRLHAHRCLVSLISSTTEYVLAESTRTISLQYDQVEDVRDKLWLGTCSFPRDDGINVSALDVWRKARSVRPDAESDDVYFTDSLTPHVCVVSDLRNHPDHRARPFTRHCPSDRFYASIPLRNSQGFVLGAVTVIDGKPRFGISAAELNLMEDVADTVAGHLDAVIVRLARQRSERLIQGLGLFNSGKSSLRAWWMWQEEAHLSNVGRHTDTSMTTSDRVTRMDKEFGTRDPQQTEHSSPSRRRKRGVSTGSRLEATDAADHAGATPTKRKSLSAVDPHAPPDAAPAQLPKRRLVRAAKSRSHVAGDADHFDLPTASAQTYARASNLIREALGCEGAILLNSGAIRISRRSSGGGAAAATTTTGSTSSHASGDDATPDEDCPCSIQGFSTRTKDSLRGSDPSSLHFNLSENALLRLVKRYPYGQVFNFAEGGSLHSSSADESALGSSEDVPPEKARRRLREGQVLADIIPGVRSVAFFPMWDDNKERHRSCIFVWSVTPMRFFNVAEDLTYLSAWAHSLIAELSRLEMLAADRAKGTFISSVSHELRSPLHGILAGVELLSDTDLSPFQTEMAQTISMAGNTLLDTVNHILDYSKISTFTRAQKRLRVRLDASRHRSGLSADPHEMGVRFDIDLARLTEEVVETVTSARRHERLATRELQSPEEGSVDRQYLLHPRSQGDDVSVTLEIAPRRSWVVELQPGGWSRIVSNLVGNALKYTRRGNVVISLMASDNPRHVDGQEQSRVTLTVEDTGVGMSDQFLNHHLYTPFKQEDSHSMGTGLGLSIVKSIAEDLGASLHICSQVGEGTKATLDLPAVFTGAESTKTGSGGSDALLDAPGNLACPRMHLLSPAPGAGSEHAPSSGITAEERNFMNMAKEWLRCDVSTGPAPPASKDVLRVVSERHLTSLHDGTDGFPSNPPREADPETRLLILATSMAEVRQHHSLENSRIRSAFVQQPIGPRKLFRVVSSLVNDRGAGAEPKSPSPGLITPAARHPEGRGDDSITDQAGAGDVRRKLLLVEDNAINMKLLVAFTRKLRLNYQCAIHGREALDAWSAAPHSFSVIFMDMQMPVMDGFTATAHIRQEEKRRRLQPIPIVALTGVTNVEARERAFDCGVNEYLSKPVKMKELEAVVGRFGILDTTDEPTDRS